jgi:hypothetical protein
MSGLLPKADIRPRIEHVCFVPLADIDTSIPNVRFLARKPTSRCARLMSAKCH